MTGAITGGWEFVIAAYSFTGTALAVYLVSLIFRLRAETRARRVAADATREEASSMSSDGSTGVPT